jgi:hypothetical protein
LAVACAAAGEIACRREFEILRSVFMMLPFMDACPASGKRRPYAQSLVIRQGTEELEGQFENKLPNI